MANELEQRARELFALQLDEASHHTEADNVRRGIDLESYAVELRAVEAALQQAQQPGAQAVAWPSGLLDRVKAAEQRIENGHAPRRIPADPSDVDLVLGEVRCLLEGSAPPFWLKSEATAPPPLPEGVSEDAKALAYYRPCFERTAPTYVPSRVRLNYPVCGDPPIGHTTEAPAGDYDCECNRYGAVSVRATNGKMLGIKPAEFEVLEWRENDRASLAARGEKGVQGG